VRALHVTSNSSTGGGRGGAGGGLGGFGGAGNHLHSFHLCCGADSCMSGSS